MTVFGWNLPRTSAVLIVLLKINVYQRFIPSDFGIEEDRVSPLPPFQAFLDRKRKVRRAIEAAGIPYTFVAANCCGAYFINILLRPQAQPLDITVYGDGQAFTHAPLIILARKTSLQSLKLFPMMWSNYYFRDSCFHTKIYFLLLFGPWMLRKKRINY